MQRFLIESGLLCAFGGLLGLLLAWGARQLITVSAGVTMTITIVYVSLIAIIASSVVGMLAGIYPASKPPGSIRFRGPYPYNLKCYEAFELPRGVLRERRW